MWVRLRNSLELSGVCGLFLFRRALFTVASSFLLMTGCISMVEANQEEPNEVVFISAKCAIALSQALDDLDKWFSSSHLNLEYANFKEYVEAKFGLVTCSETEKQISVDLFPRIGIQGAPRGGGVSYIIDKKRGVILERTFAR